MALKKYSRGKETRYSIGYIRKYAVGPFSLAPPVNAGWKNDVRWNPKVRTMSKYSRRTGVLYYIEVIPYGKRMYVALYHDGSEYTGKFEPFRSAKDILSAVRNQ